MTDHQPPQPLTVREQHLLGKHLLGQLDDAERREFDTARRRSVTLQSAIAVIEQTSADAGLLTNGHDDVMRYTPDAPDLPAFYEPQRLAANLARSTRGDRIVIGAILLGATAAATLAGRMPALHLAGLLVAGLLLVVWLMIRQRRQLQELASGGADWERTVATLRSVEKLATQPRIGLLGWCLGIWSFTGGPIVLVLIGRAIGWGSFLHVTAIMLLGVLPAMAGALLVGWARTFRQLRSE